MAKNSITDYDKVSANNTDVQSVDISEGCSPSGINNAIREVMADLADVNDGTVALTSPAIGTSLDMNGNDLILDADGDSKIEASTDDTINIISGGTTGLTVDSSGHVQIKQNNTATSNYPSASTWSITGVPDWANKITLVTKGVSQNGSNEINLRFIVGGSAVSTAVYNNNEFRGADNVATVHYGYTDSGTVANQLKITGFGATENLFCWMLTVYKVDTNTYVYNAPVHNDYFKYFNYIKGSIETTGAIEGFQFSTAGTFDSGKARIFWE